MSEEKRLLTSPQLVLQECSGFAVVLTPRQAASLYKKSKQSGYSFDTLEEVYSRGYVEDLSEHTAFNRVNSFISGGAAAIMDKDLVEKNGLWDNIHAKRKRIKSGSGERMRKPGSEGAPSKQDFKDSQSEAYTGAEKVSNNPNKALSRQVGTKRLADVYKNSTPGQSTTLSTIKKVLHEGRADIKRLQGTLGVRKDGIIGPITRAAIADRKDLSQNMNKPADAPSTPKAPEPVASKNDTKPSAPKTPEMLVKPDSRNRSDADNLQRGIERQQSAVHKNAVNRLMKNTDDPIMRKYMSAGKHDDDDGRSNDITLGSRHDGDAGLEPKTPPKTTPKSDASPYGKLKVESKKDIIKKTFRESTVGKKV